MSHKFSWIYIYIYMFPDFPHDPFFRVETEINSLWIQFDLI